MKVAGVEVLKTCSACGESKPLDSGFHKKSASRDGYTSECRACRNRKNAAWRAANPEYHRQWIQENYQSGTGHQQQGEKEAQDKQTPAPYQNNHQRPQSNTNCGGIFRLISRGDL